MVDGEKQLEHLERKIKDLQAFAREQEINLNSEIRSLEEKAQAIRQEIYSNLSPWQRVKMARNMKRPTTLDYINMLCTDFMEMHGDRLFSDDPAIIGGIARFEQEPVTVIGHQKGRSTRDNIARNFGMPHPEGYRKALRLMEQADKFGRPIISFIDTPGAYPGLGAEERGQGEAIARNLRDMSRLRVPMLVVVTGEGGSGGALALACGDWTGMFENAVYSVISPEGCASILWKDPGKAPEAAESLKLTAEDLKKAGVIDAIIDEPRGGCQQDPAAMGEKLREQIKIVLSDLKQKDHSELLQRRWERINRIGVWTEMENKKQEISQ